LYQGARSLMLHFVPLEIFAGALELIEYFGGGGKAARGRLWRLLFVTLNVQLSLGYVGIRYLRHSQERKLALTDLRPSNNEVAHAFAWKVVRFIAFVGIPYMLQRTVFENVESLVLGRFSAQCHHEVRLQWPFRDDGVYLAAIHAEGTHSPSTYSAAMDTVVQQTHAFISSKLFSVPKLALLPGVMRKSPSTLLAVLPLVVAVDFVKSGAEAYLTSSIEAIGRRASETASWRSKVEEHDLKHADALRRNGPEAQRFTKKKWAELTLRYQALWLQSASLQGCRNFIVSIVNML
jgi:hypothetical protein